MPDPDPAPGFAAVGSAVEVAVNADLDPLELRWLSCCCPGSVARGACSGGVLSLTERDASGKCRLGELGLTEAVMGLFLRPRRNVYEFGLGLNMKV